MDEQDYGEKYVKKKFWVHNLCQILLGWKNEGEIAEKNECEKLSSDLELEANELLITY